MSEDFWNRSAGAIGGYNNLHPLGEQMPGSSPQINLSGSSDGRYKYSSKELDAETSLYYFGTRYYDAWSGTWISVDPLANKYPGWSVSNESLKAGHGSRGDVILSLNGLRYGLFSDSVIQGSGDREDIRTFRFQEAAYGDTAGRTEKIEDAESGHYPKRSARPARQQAGGAPRR